MQGLEKLAMFGGEPIRSEPFPSWPFYGKEQIGVAAEILASGRVNYWTGQEGRKFESEFARFIGREFAVALANGTVALELALYSLGIGPGDEVIVPCRSFIASASCVALQGAIPVFVDVDRETQNITAVGIQGAISDRTRAAIAVHLAGWPCDMDSIMEVASRYGIKILEDCAQAHGAKYKQFPVGSFGDVATFSFCQDKIISTAGEGGMLLTDDKKVWEKAWSYKDHGKSAEILSRKVFRGNGYSWVHENLGTNLRMTEIQAAIGRKQLNKLELWVKKRRANAKILQDFLSRFQAIRIATPGELEYHSYYKYYCFLELERLNSNWDRDKILDAISSEGIPCGSGVCPEIYQESAFAELGRKSDKRLDIAKELGESSLMFQIHPTLEEGDLNDVCRAVQKVLEVAAK